MWPDGKNYGFWFQINYTCLFLAWFKKHMELEKDNTPYAFSLDSSLIGHDNSRVLQVTVETRKKLQPVEVEFCLNSKLF